MSKTKRNTSKSDNNNKKVIVEFESSGTKARKLNSKQKMRIAQAVTAPSGAGYLIGTPAMRIETRSETTRVYNCEILQGFNTSALAVAVTQAMTPNPLAWLNGIAINFSKWKWVQLRYIYVPNCATSTPGAVTIGLQYDTNEAAPASRLQLSATRDSVSGPVWAGWEGATLLNSYQKTVPGAMKVDCDVGRLQKPWYPYITATNYGGLTAIDRNIYSPGQIVAITDGGPAVAVAAGTIYVQYVVDFIEPVSSAVNA